MRVSGLARLAAAGFIALVIVPRAYTQTPPSFEVAAIRPNHSGSVDSNVDSTPGGRLTVTNETIRDLILLAFSVKDYQLSGAPGWIGSERYDIAAKTAGAPKVGFEDEKSLLRGLLAERFAMKSHLETQTGTVYSLRIGKSGSKLTRHDDGTGTKARASCGHLLGGRVTTAVLATMLSRQLEHDVIDETGLPGKYDFELNWTPDTGRCSESSDDRPSIFTAVQEQTGLVLEATKGPIQILVIDHIERPSAN
jgi:uncharacterized protein (TIGR03435 family)